MKKKELESWQRLYECMIEIKKLAPWEKLDSDDLIELRLKDSEIPVLMSVMGNRGECYGIAVYPTLTGQMSLLEKLEETEMIEIYTVDPLSYAPAREEALTGYLGDREEVDKETYALIKELGLKFRGKNNWIFFRAFHHGRVPRYLNQEEIKLLIACYEALIESLNHLEQVAFIMSPVIEYDQKAGGYRFTEGEIDVSISLRDPDEFEDELMIRRLKKAKRVPNELEMTYFYLPILGKEEGQLAVMLLLVDRYSEMIVAAHPLESDADVSHMAHEVLERFISEIGRPARVDIRVEELGKIIGDFCEQLDIPIYLTPEFLLLDEIAMEMMELMF